MTRIQPRRGTAAQWTTANPVLADGELGYEKDTKRWKRGDGVTAWNALLYTATGLGLDVLGAINKRQARLAIEAASLRSVGFIDFTTKPDGPIPATMDTGQPLATFGNTPFVVSGGAAVHVPVGTADTAGYLQADPIGEVPTRVMVYGEFPTVGATSQFTLVVPEDLWGPPGGYPATSAAQEVAGIHDAWYGNGIHYHTRWNIGTQTFYASSEAAYPGYSQPQLARYAPVWGTGPVWFDFWIDQATGTLIAWPPDGGAPYIIKNDIIRDDIGPAVVLESFETGGTLAGTPFKFYKIAYDVAPRRKDSPLMSKFDLAEFFPALRAASAPGLTPTVAGSNGGVTTLTADSARFQVFTTGSPSTTNHTVKLPPTVKALEPWSIRCAMSGGQLTVQDSTGATMIVLTKGQRLDVMPQVLAPAAIGQWLYDPVTSNIGTQTLTDTRVNPRIAAPITSTATLTPSFGTADIYKITAQAQALTVAPPANTTDGHRVRVWIKDNGVSQTIAWNAVYVTPTGGTAPPTATTPGKWHMIDYEYHSTAGVAAITAVRVLP